MEYASEIYDSEGKAEAKSWGKNWLINTLTIKKHEWTVINLNNGIGDIWEKVFKNGPSKMDHTSLNSLKVVFHKFYSDPSWILFSTYLGILMEMNLNPDHSK